MTVTKPNLDDMPQETSEKTIHLMQLGDDVLGSVFDRRLASRDPWLADVLASGWDQSPALPTDELAQFVTEQDETTYAQVDDVESEVSKEFQSLSDTKKKIWKKAEDQYGQGTQADEWTTNDIKELIRGGKAGTIRRYVGEMDKKENPNSDDPTPFRYTEEKDGQSKLYVVEDSYENTVAADGGLRWMYDWDDQIEQLTKRDLLVTEGNEPRDWFASENWMEWMSFVKKTHKISDHLEELSYIQRTHLDQPSSRETTRKRWMKRARDELMDMVETFKESFYLLKNLSQSYYNATIMWASDTGKKVGKIKPKSNRPPVRMEKVQKKIDAKQYAIIDSYLRPLISVIPEHNTGIEAVHDHGDRIHQMTDSVGSWLTWVHSCCQDILDYGKEVQTANSLSDDARAFYQVLDDEWEGDPGRREYDGNSDWTHESAVPWEELLSRSATVRGSHWTEASALTALKSLGRAGMEDPETDWVGVWVYDKSQGPIGLHDECEPEVVLIKENSRWEGDSQLEWWDHNELEWYMEEEFR